MKRLLLILALSFFTALANAADQRQEIVILYPDLKPLKQAILIDIMKEVEKRLPDKRFTFQKYPLARAIIMAKQGYGGIISFSKNQARLQVFDYSDPLYVEEILLVTLAEKTFSFQKITDLKDMRIGGILKASYGDEFEYGKSAIFRYIESSGYNETQVQTNLLKSLLAGNIDAALIGPGPAGLAQTINSDPQLKIIANRFVALPLPMVKDPNYLAFSKELKMTGFLREFNAALAVANKSGAMKKIIESHSKPVELPK